MKIILDKLDSAWGYKPIIWVVVIFICVLFAWLALSEIDEQVKAVGRIVPAGKTKVIQHLEGGIVKEILVEEGQIVQKGQVLFVVRNIRAKSELKEIAVQIKANEIKQMRLGAERDSLTRKEFRKLVEKSLSEKDIDLYNEIILTEEELFNARRQAFVEKINGLKERFKQKELRLNDLKTRIKNIKAELATAKEQLQIKKKLRSVEAISRSQYLTTESEVKSFVTKLAKVQKEIPVVAAERDEIINLLSETQQNRQSEIISELNEVKIDIKKLKERLQPMQDQMLRTEIVSPIRGIINKIYVNTLGGIVKPGGNFAEITPLDETLIVEGRININDRGKIWPNLPVVAKIMAYDYSIYGGINGKLTYISADSFVDSNDNNAYYQVRASLSRARLGKNKILYPGMMVELNIIAGKTTILHSILRPFWQIRENALREK